MEMLEGKTFVPLLPCTLSMYLSHLAIPELCFNNKLVRICLPMQEMWIQSLGWADPLEKEMATHSSILAWENPMEREPWQATIQGVSKSWA